MAKLRQVTQADCGPIDGSVADIRGGLHHAVTEICPGLRGETLWERISRQHCLGIGADCATWVTSMNAAIQLWNTNQPITNCEQIECLYGV